MSGPGDTRTTKPRIVTGLWHTEPVHPLSTVLFLAGYGLALPLGSRLPSIVANQQRLAFAGHQFGILIALVGWLSRGSFILATLHLVWVVATRIWYGTAERRQRQAPAAPSRPA